MKVSSPPEKPVPNPYVQEVLDSVKKRPNSNASSSAASLNTGPSVGAKAALEQAGSHGRTAANPYVKEAFDFVKKHASNPETRGKFNFVAAAYGKMMGVAWGTFGLAAGIAYLIHKRQERNKENARMAEARVAENVGKP
eukprot:ANDGO_03826.mRNA.1 hypothetical protein